MFNAKGTLCAIAGIFTLFALPSSANGNSGCNDEGCYVSAQRSNGTTFIMFASYNDGSEYGQYDSTTTDLGGDGGGFSENPCTPIDELRQDALSRAFEAAMQELAKDLEHGALIVNRGGLTRMLSVVTGNETSVPQGQLINTVAAAGFNFGDVVGLIHYQTPSNATFLNADGTDSGQPDYYQQGVNNANNRGPSRNDYNFSGNGGYSGSLYSLARDHIGQSAMNEWSSNFSHYIVGPDGVVRQYRGAQPNNATEDFKINDAEAEFAERDAQSQC